MDQKLVQALSALPTEGGGDAESGCLDAAACAPKVQSDGNGIALRAPAGTVTLHTANCGALDPCDLLSALTDLRSSLI